MVKKKLDNTDTPGNDVVQRSYYLPPVLLECFTNWCAPGRDYSAKIAGFILAGMAIDNEGLLKLLSKLAYSKEIQYDTKAHKPIGASINQAKRLIVEALLDEENLRLLAVVSPLERSQIVAEITESKGKPSRKK